MKIKRLIFLLAVIFSPVAKTFSQCAMCRATIENNLSNGDIGIGAGLNFGIMYLFVTPYLLIMIVGYMWYRNSRKSTAHE